MVHKSNNIEENNVDLKRRNLLKTISVITGYTLTVGATTALMNGCKADTSSDWKAISLSKDNLAIVEEAAARIIPTTDTPGAKEALVHRYIDNLVAKILPPEESEAFISALDNFDKISREKYKKKFVSLSDIEKDDVLSILSEEKQTGTLPTLFDALKSFTVTGFYTSEVGAKTLNYLPIPGPYEGCVDLASLGGKTWAL